jgi:hypothetical protein
MTLKDRAATALDRTHDKTRAGLQTESVRWLLACYLDGKKMKASMVRKSCAYLEMIARSR